MFFVIFQSALAVAIVNIQIPILLGDVVNIVSKYSAETAAQNNFVEEIRKPGLRIIYMYSIQVDFLFLSKRTILKQQ